MKKQFSLGQKVKIKRGARLFYNLSANDFKYKNGQWSIAQITEDEYKRTKRGCYTKKVNFDGEVVITDPQILFGEDLKFCEIIIADKHCKILADDLYNPQDPEGLDTTPPKVWNF